MLVILRIIFTGLFLYCVVQARENARDNLVGGDLANAFWVGCGVLAALAEFTIPPARGSAIFPPR